MTDKNKVPGRLTPPEIRAWTSAANLAMKLGGKEAGRLVLEASPLPTFADTGGRDYVHLAPATIKAELAKIRVALKIFGKEAAVEIWNGSVLPKIKGDV